MTVGAFVSREEVEGPAVATREEAQRVNVAGRRWTEMFLKMQEHPGEWMLMYEGDQDDSAYQVRSRIKKYMQRWMPDGVYEMRSHRVYENRVFQGSRLYGRFVEAADEAILKPGVRGPAPM